MVWPFGARRLRRPRGVIDAGARRFMDVLLAVLALR
jgi:hypothetical protein